MNRHLCQKLSLWICLSFFSLGVFALSLTERSLPEFASPDYQFLSSNTAFFSISVFELDGKIQVTWEPNRALEAAYYVVERKTTDGNFQAIGGLNMKKRNSSKDHLSYLDPLPYNGNVSYRIKQVLQNGEVFYSPERELFYLNIQPIKLLATHESDYVEMEFDLREALPLELEIMDMQGRIAYQRFIPAIESQNRIHLSTQQMNRGMYIIQLKSPNHSWVQRMWLP